MNTTPLRRAIVGRIEGDATVRALLPPDPRDPTGPALFEGARNQAPPIYPCVTYRLGEGLPDRRFQPPPAAGGGPSPIETITVEVEAWSQDESAAEVERIADRVGTLFDGASFAITAAPGNGVVGRVVESAITSHSRGLRDPDRRAWFVLLRLTFLIHWFTPS